MNTNKNESSKVKTIVFRAHSPFTILTSALIGAFHYKNDKKILYSGYTFDIEFQKRILNSGLFDEIYMSMDGEKLITGVERQVEAFLERYPNIDVFFLHTVEDRLGYLAALKLCGKSKICLYPEGVATIMYQEKINMFIYEVDGHFKHIREFYEKYPVNIKIFDETWLYDVKIPQGGYDMKSRQIEVNRLLRDESYIVDQLNILFNVSADSLESCDVFFLDSGLSESDRMEFHVEQQVIRQLFYCLPKKKVIIKPHPGTDQVYEWFKYQDVAVEIFENDEVPWELIYLNLLLRNKKEKVVLIVHFLATAVLSSVNITTGRNKIDIISMEKIEMPFLADYLVKTIEFNAQYFEREIAQRDNVQIYFPQNFEQLQDSCQQIFKDIPIEKDGMKETSFEDISEEKFKIAGNFLSKSFLYINKPEKMAHSYFDFSNRNIELSFYVDEEAGFTELIWWPNEYNLFASVSMLKIYVELEDGKKIFLYEAATQDKAMRRTLLEADGSVKINADYHGYCKRIWLKAQLNTKNSYVQLAKNYEDVKWRSEFWEGWNDIEESNRLQHYVEKHALKYIWIFGDGKIGTLINKRLKQLHIDTKYIATKGKNLTSYRVYGIDELPMELGKPDLLIITPMQDYRTIYYNIPISLRDRAIGLNEFIRAVMRGNVDEGSGF